MADKPINVWGIHAGAMGDGDTLFLQTNCVALGWPLIGDLSKLKQDKDSIKSYITAAYPATKPGAVPVHAGMLYRFIHEVQIGDLVAYPSKSDRMIHIGTITGPYKFDTSHTAAYPNRRSVDWKCAVDRTKFTQGALYEVGSALSFFAIRNYADEFKAAASGTAQPVAVTADVSVGLVTASIEENTRDFILKRLSQELKGHPFAEFVGHLLVTMGYKSRVSPPGPDGGVDIVSHKDELGFEPPVIRTQVKSTSGSIGNSDVSALMGTVSHGEFGMVVTLGAFSPAARNFAKGKANLRLIDGPDVVDLILEHYEQLDSKYKGLIPLKRMYIPEVVSDTEAPGG